MPVSDALELTGLLRGVAAHGLSPGSCDYPARPLSDPMWTHLLSTAHKQRLTGFLAEAVTSGAFPTTEAQRDAVTEAHREAMVEVLLLEQHLLAATSALTKADIDYRVLKGSAYAHTLYAAPSLRPFGDIDLLVPTEAFDDAVEVLREHGYERAWPEPRPGFTRRFGKAATLVGLHGVQADLHRTLAPGPFGLTIREEDLFADTVVFELAGRQLAALGPKQRFLHACYHAALGDDPPRLLALRDVAEQVLGQRFDAEGALQMAARWEGEAVVARALRLTWDTLGLAEANRLQAWARQHSPTPKEQRALAAYAGGERRYGMQTLATLRLLPRYADKAALLRAFLWPRRTFLRARGLSYAQWVRRNAGFALTWGRD